MKNKRKTKYVLTKRSYAAIAVLAAVAIGVTAWSLWPAGAEEPEPEPPAPPYERTTVGGRGTILTPDNIEEVEDMLSQPVQDAQYTVSMTRNWVFDTALTPSRNASVDNLERNTRTVYFDVILDETGEMVYTSPYIPRGYTLDDFALDVELDPGEHRATVTFFLVDDDYEVVADVSVSVTLTING